MSTTLSTSRGSQRDDLWVVSPASTAQPSLQPHKDPVPPDENASATQFQELLELLHYSIASNTEEARAHMFYDRIDAFDRALHLEPSPGQKWLGWVYYSIMTDFSRISPVVTGTESAHQRHTQQTVNETKYVGFQPNLEDDLVDILGNLFDDACDEVFEDGMDTAFSNNLNHIVQVYGEIAIHALERVIHSDHVDVDVVEEALRQVGSMDDVQTHYCRLVLLERKLISPNSRIRDAASIGIEAMDDPAAIESLQKAISNEQYGQLRQNLEAVLAQLQDTR